MSEETNRRVVSSPEIVAWLFNLDRLQERLLGIEVKQPRLSPAETQRAAGIPAADRQRAWLASRVGLRLALENFTGETLAGVPFEITDRGRPYLPQPAPHFSLAHAGPYVLVLVGATGPVGIDIEEVRDRKMAPQRQVQIEQFACAIAGGQPLPEAEGGLRFIQAWCRLEAFAKADGRGVGRVLSAAGIMGPGSRACRASLLSERKPISTDLLASYRAWDLPLATHAPGYAAAVAGLSKCPFADLRVRDGGALTDTA